MNQKGKHTAREDTTMREDMAMSKGKTERTDAQGIMREQPTGGRTADIFIR